MVVLWYKTDWKYLHKIVWHFSTVLYWGKSYNTLCPKCNQPSLYIFSHDDSPCSFGKQAIRHIIKCRTLRQSYLCLENLYFCVAQSLLKFSSLMLPFGTDCLPVSLCNPSGAVKSEFKPESEVMFGPLQLILCGVLLSVRGLWSHPTVWVLWPLWVPQEGTEAPWPTVPSQHYSAPASQGSAVLFSYLATVRDAMFEAVQNNTT